MDTVKFGILKSCINKITNEKYSDWRSDYVGQAGLIYIRASRHSHPGQFYIYFYPYKDGLEQPYLRTSCGIFDESDLGIILHSKNSVYEFEYGDFDLTDMMKKELLLNADIYQVYSHISVSLNAK